MRLAHPGLPFARAAAAASGFARSRVARAADSTTRGSRPFWPLAMASSIGVTDCGLGSGSRGRRMGTCSASAGAAALVHGAAE